VGKWNLVGKHLDKMVGTLAGIGRHGLVLIACGCRIGLDPLEHAFVTPDHLAPSDGNIEDVEGPPDIERQRIDDRHAMAPLGAELAADESELQRVYPLDPRRAGEHDE